MKSLKISFIVFFVTMLQSHTFAQNSVTGEVTDTSASQKLEYANVSLLLDKDSSVVATINTSAQGSFQFESVKAGRYFVSASYLGYTRKTSDIFEIDGQKGTKDIGKLIIASESKKIDEVQVVGQRLKGTDLADRTVYTLTEEISKTAKSALDLLKRVPSVQLDFKNAVSLNGKTNIIILVDGRERDASYLEQLDPLSVDKVEVISQPTAKYEGSVSGIINVILKKDKRVGFSGSFNGNLPTSREAFMGGARANLEYGVGKFRFYFSGGGYDQSFNTENSVDRNSYFIKGNHDTIPQKFQSISTGTGKYSGIYPTVGFDYFINDKNMLNFSSSFNSSRDNGSTDDQRYLKNDSSIYYDVNNKTDGKNSAQFYSLFYKKTFPKPGHELTVDLTFNQNKGNENSVIKETHYTDYLKMNSLPSLDPYGTNQSFKRKSYKGKVDYTLPLFTNFKLETGGQYYNQDISNGSANIGALKDSLFNYTEDRYAGYGIVSGKHGKFNGQVGFRLEYAVIHIENKDAVPFPSPLPNFSLQYQVTEKQSLRIGYTKEVSRPQARDLDPYNRITDSTNLTISRGNPNLKPMYIEHFNLVYSLNTKIGFISSELSHERYRNAQTGIIFNEIYMGRTATVSQQDNIAEGRDWSYSLSGNLQPAKWFFINPNFKITRQHSFTVLDAYKNTFPDRVNTYWSGGIYAQFTLPKAISFSFYGNYSSPSIAGYNDYKANYFYMVTLDKRLFKDKGSIGVSWYLPFSSKYRVDNSHYINNTHTIEETSLGYFVYKYVAEVHFSYRFKYGKENKKIDRDKSIETDFKGGKL